MTVHSGHLFAALGLVVAVHSDYAPAAVQTQTPSVALVVHSLIPPHGPVAAAENSPGVVDSVVEFEVEYSQTEPPYTMAVAVVVIAVRYHEAR